MKENINSHFEDSSYQALVVHISEMIFPLIMIGSLWFLNPYMMGQANTLNTGL